MNTFDIDSEIDKLVEKFSEELRVRLKKVVTRSEKLVLKQYIATQKNTASGKYKYSSSPSSKQQTVNSRSTRSLNRPDRKGSKTIRYKDKNSVSD